MSKEVMIGDIRVYHPDKEIEVLEFEPDRGLERFMKEYFVLKEQYKRLTEARNDFMENTYKCTNIGSDSYDEPHGNCHQRRRYHSIAIEGQCEACSKRDWYYLERKKNAHRRSSIMLKVKHLVR